MTVEDAVGAEGNSDAGVVEEIEEKVDTPEAKPINKTESVVSASGEQDKEPEPLKEQGIALEPKDEELSQLKEDEIENVDNRAVDLSAISKKDNEIKDWTNKYQVEQTKADNLKKDNEALQAVIKEIVDGKLEALSDQYKELMPEGNVIKQLAWLTKAEASGLGKKERPEIEIGRTLDLGTNNKADEKTLTAHQKIANYFGDFYKR